MVSELEDRWPRAAMPDSLPMDDESECQPILSGEGESSVRNSILVSHSGKTGKGCTILTPKPAHESHSRNSLPVHTKSMLGVRGAIMEFLWRAIDNLSTSTGCKSHPGRFQEIADGNGCVGGSLSSEWSDRAGLWVMDCRCGFFWGFWRSGIACT